MHKGYKIAIIAGVGILIILVAMVFVELFKPNKSSNTDPENVPSNQGQALLLDEQQELASKTSDLVQYYYTYFYGSYNSATNAAESGTREFQEQALARHDALAAQTPEGYYIETVPNILTFSYNNKGDGTVETTIQAKVTEWVEGAEAVYEANFYVTFIRQATEWKVNAVRKD